MKQIDMKSKQVPFVLDSFKTSCNLECDCACPEMEGTTERRETGELHTGSHSVFTSELIFAQ